jgi:hypothetical protein
VQPVTKLWRRPAVSPTVAGMSELEDVQKELRSASLESRKSTNAPLAPERVEALVQRGKAIYGSDTRIEASAASHIPKEVVQAVCMFVETTRLQPAPGGYVLQTASFGAKYNLCSGQRFRDQPLLGYGSGFLVRPDVVATAGHCVNDDFDVTKICVLFDFEVGANGVDKFRKASQVYFVAERLKFVEEPNGADYGFVRLDRPVAGVKPLTIAAGDPKFGAPVYVVGHPVGLPKKLADGAKVLDDTPKTHFMANLNTFGGNSGSPVLTSAHEVCGILVRGEQDFVVKGDCVVAVTFPLGKAGEAVCRSSIWSNEISNDKLSKLADIIGGPAAPALLDPGTRRQNLAAFLCSAFSEDELRRLARHNHLLEPLVSGVSWKGAKRDVADAMVELLEDRKLIGNDFFRLLTGERPRRDSEIEVLRHEWLSL